VTWDHIRNVMGKDRVEQLRREFFEAIGVEAVDGGLMSRSDFLKLVVPLERLEQSRINSAVKDRIAQCLAYKGDSKGVSFDEFLYGSFICKFADTESLYRFVFSLFDLDSNGYISKKEFRKVLSISIVPAHTVAESIPKDKDDFIDFYTTIVFRAHEGSASSEINYSRWRRFADEDDVSLGLVSALQVVETEFPTLEPDF